MPISKPVDLFLKAPLYAPETFQGDEVWAALDVIYYSGTYDSFCVKCKRDSTFRVTAGDRPDKYKRNHQREQLLKQNGMKPELPRLPAGLYTVAAVCTRQEIHTQHFVFLVDYVIHAKESGPPDVEWTFQKIGQQPSYGDLHLLDVKKYGAVLSKQQLGELVRAIGLASHDVGVGAYVYLRRIFETLVEEAHAAAKVEPEWDEDVYQRSRMSERIALLKSVLPRFLVEHHGMYGLLSKGIHELSERECLEHFSTLRLGIELILDERVEAREREAKIAAAKAALQRALGPAGA